MKILRKITVLLSFALFALGCVNKKADASDIKLVTAQEMKTLLELEDVQLVDVRSSNEYEQIHIANAQNIDFSSPTFEDDINKLDKTKPVVLYCKGGNKSAKCAKKLKEAGFEKVYDLEGGISKWKHSEVLQIQEKS